MTKPLSEKLARGARIMRDTSQLKTQHPEWLLNEMADSADLLDEAAALARRVESAHVARVSMRDWCAVIDETGLPNSMIGKHVRLVPEVD